MSRKFELGDRVEFVKPLIRHKDKGLNFSWRVDEESEPTKGIIVGKRTVKDGSLGWDDEYRWYEFGKTYNVYLIAYALHRTPAYVSPENIIKIKD